MSFFSFIFSSSKKKSSRGYFFRRSKKIEVNLASPMINYAINHSVWFLMTCICRTITHEYLHKAVCESTGEYRHTIGEEIVVKYLNNTISEKDFKEQFYS